MEIDRGDLVRLMALCYGALDDEWTGAGTPWDCDRLRLFADKYGIEELEVIRAYHSINT